MKFLSILFLVAATAIAMGQPTQPTKRISETEARSFGEEMEREFSDNGSDFFMKALDPARMIEICLAGQPGNEQIKDGFRSGLMKGSFAKDLAKGLENFTSYKFLRMITTNERPQLVFRCLSENGALNYHILELERTRGTRIRVVDMYIMISGEKMSELFRRLYLIAVAESDRSFLSRLARGQGDLAKYGKDIQRMGKMAREGDGKGALKLYETLPESLRAEKCVLIMRLLAAQQSDEKAYLSAIEAFEKHFPDDPSLALVSVDGFVLKKQNRKAIASVEKLNRFIGGDPYLLLIQAGQYVELKEKDKARELANQAMEQEPSLPNTYDLLLGLSLEEKNFEEAARLLTLTEKNLGVDMLDAVQTTEDYKPFLNSTAGKKWKENHK